MLEKEVLKGLAKIVPLPYGSQMKMTISKYYTHQEGIQAIDYSGEDGNSENYKEKDVFFTSNGRKVYDKGGCYRM